MATFSPGSCSTTHQARINDALDLVRRRIANWDLPCLGDLRTQILDYLACSLTISCEDCDVNGSSVRGSDAITLCEDFLDTATLQRISAVVFHEMVHAAGGTELDAEALENHFFTGAGATAPTSDDWPKFSSDGGEFVIWDSSTGQLFELCMADSFTTTPGTQLTPTFIEPS
jgi:hypothetical protein